MIILRVIRGIHEHFPARASEWALALMLFNLGLVLAMPQETMMESASLSGLARIASEEVWAGALLLIGIVRLLALIINGTFAHAKYGRWSPHVRAFLALVSCFFWMQIAVGLTLSPTIATGIGIYPVLLALDMYNTARASGDAALIDRARHDDRDR
ncbi:MAG: hypothetical protein Q8M31_18475 [Beijerinckiaceae bacterium]|nr:hypothetical protein [Beijerinckiaceae bacterium]